MSQRIVIVGAGAIGSATALRLTETGADVTIVEAQAPGAGTTGTSFAWIGASHHGLREYLDLNLAGVTAHRRLQMEIGARPWYHATGSLHWNVEADQQAIADEVPQLRERGYSAALVTPDRAGALEPAIRLAPDVEHVAWLPDEGYVEGRAMAADLVSLAQQRGARLRAGSPVAAIDESASGVAVALESGERIDADAVVLCSGRRTWQLAEMAGSHLPMVTEERPGTYLLGLLVATTALPVPLRRIALPDNEAIRPHTAGRALLHTDEHDLLLETDTGEARLAEIAADVLDVFRPHVALPASVGVDDVIVGRRSLPADLMPVAGWLPGCSRVYAAATHSGVTLAAIMAELVSAEVAGDVEQPMLQSYRPDRFQAVATT